MNLFKSTSPCQLNWYSKILTLSGKKVVLSISLTVIFFLTFSSASASDGIYASTTSSTIHLSGLSINISPGGFHIGIGVPSYGRTYGHSHYRSAPRHSWKHSRQHHRRHHHYDSPKRFNRGNGWKDDRHRNRAYGWKKDRHRGHFRGKSARGRGGYRGGRW